MPKSQIFTWKIGGQAGGGQQAAGLIFTKACVRGGLFAFDSSEYPSRIRGGIVTYRVSVSTDPVLAIYRQTNLLIALTREAFDYCINDVSADGVILYDSDSFKVETGQTQGKKVYPLPLATLAKEAGVKPIAANVIITGAGAALLNYDLDILKDVISDIFADKGKEVVEMNHIACKAGYDYALKNLKPEEFSYKLSAKKPDYESVIITANDTVALGAVAAGCKFFAAYPMTPASSIMHNLAAWAEKAGMVVKHAEDEISAVHMAIGAGFAGVRSMVATSGGGFALMTEGLSLAGNTEVPLVIAESQRPGPATGLPTWTEQGDLAYLVTAGHGEFIRVILAPGDGGEAFYLTAQAFNLAEKYQIPVFILLDKYISEGHLSMADPDASLIVIDRGKLLTEKELAKINDYKRYALTADGVSPRAIPGQANGVYLANSDEHDENGFTIEGFNAEMRIKQVEKRLAKLENILNELPAPLVFGPKDADIALIGWGSAKGPVLEALKSLPDIKYIHVSCPWPLREEKLRQAIGKTKKLICIENNATGQFADILRGQAGINPDEKLLKYDGAQFFPEEIIDAVNQFKN